MFCPDQSDNRQQYVCMYVWMPVQVNKPKLAYSVSMLTLASSWSVAHYFMHCVYSLSQQDTDTLQVCQLVGLQTPQVWLISSCPKVERDELCSSRLMHMQSDPLSGGVDSLKFVKSVVFLFQVDGNFLSALSEKIDTSLRAVDLFLCLGSLDKRVHEDMWATLGGGCPFLQHGEEKGCWIKTWQGEMAAQSPRLSIFSDLADVQSFNYPKQNKS